MKVQLIVPALEGFKYTRKSGCPPLGLASIASFLRWQSGGSTDIEILDGELVGDNDVIVSRLVAGSLVGILTKTPNYPGAVKIATKAKENGCMVVLGGVYATNMAETILRNRGEIIDFVVRGYGEKPMLRILEMIQSKQAFPKNRVIVEPMPAFDEIPWPSREWFDMEQYIKNFTADRKSWSIGRGTNLFTHMGCLNKCDFCSRIGPLGGGVYWREPRFIWAEVSELVSRYGIEYVLDFSDSLTQNHRWLHRLVESRPAALDHLRWHVFANAEKIPEFVALFKKLGVVHVFVGVESGDELVAQSVRKGRKFSPTIIRNGIARLVEAGMRVTPSFVYGLRGETEASMERTFQFARDLVDLSSAEEIFASELIPWPGSPAWEIVREFFGDTDLLDVVDLKDAWLKKVIKIDPVRVKAYVDATLALAKYPISIQRKES